MTVGEPLVLDASAVVHLLIDRGPTGAWVAEHVATSLLCAPSLMPFEAANAVRRAIVGGRLDVTGGLEAHQALGTLPVRYLDYQQLAAVAWTHWSSLTGYDASYVACAQLLGAPLLTLDRRLARGAPPDVEVRCPPED